MAKIKNNEQRWHVAVDYILEGADLGATLKQIKYALDLTYGYVPLKNIKKVLEDNGYVEQRNKIWRKKKDD